MSAPPPRGAALVVLGPGALPLARRLKRRLPGAAIHAPRCIAADATFIALAPDLRALFRAGTPIVGLCAAGILIRILAPLLRDKRAEPPVVAVAEDGSAAVPLLGGHRGGNDLARAIARITGGRAALTTASELRLGFALDAPPDGWHVANPARAKSLMAKLIAGKTLTVAVEAGDADWLTAHKQIRIAKNGRADIRVTDRAVARRERALVLHPPVLALGVGTSRGCPPEELRALVRRTLKSAGLAGGAVAVAASIDIKMDEPAVAKFETDLAVPVRYFSAAQLRRQTKRLANPSEAALRATGCYGVAEGAALAAVGKAGNLLVEKRKSTHATCAVARAARPIEAARIGRARGSLAVLGIGPGDAGWRTPEVSAALEAASDVVGYRLYLDLLGPAIAGKRRHMSGLGAETERARRALDLAAEGKRVALVSSGDAGIYGLATLVMELIDREPKPDWQRVDLRVLPGLSALQAAAARAGAPLGHDFCVLSLSDLLTPWTAIKRRLEAAAKGDFVLALYNPRSARRTTQLATALRILRRHRPKTTPVILARNLGRKGETLTVTTLATVDHAEVDMLTLVLIGSSATRTIPGDPPRVYPPRGYARKAARR